MEKPYLDEAGRSMVHPDPQVLEDLPDDAG